MNPTANSLNFSVLEYRFSVVQAQDAYNCSVKRLEKKGAGATIFKGENHTHEINVVLTIVKWWERQPTTNNHTISFGRVFFCAHASASRTTLLSNNT